jgi:hypothetical protein
MIFLSQWMLWGLAALAVPVIIHLFQRRRVVSIPFSTLRYLRQVTVRTARRSRVEHLLLLLLRCAVFAFLILAVARPAIEPKTARFLHGNVPSTSILILDNSMSMNYRVGDRTRLDDTKRLALTILNSLKPGDDVAVFAANDHVQPLIAELTVDHAAARHVIETLAPTQGRTDFAPALSAAQKLVSRSTKGVKRIFLLTDNQASGWTNASPPGNPNPAPIIIIRPDALPSVNAAITRLDFKTPFLVPGTTARGTAVVENYSAAPLRDLLEIKLADRRVSQRAVDTGPESSVEIPFEFQVPFLTGQIADGSANLQGDNLPDDDHYYFWLPVYWPPRVLIVEGQQLGPVPLHSGYYLQKALEAGGDITPKVIAANELADTPLEHFSAIFLADVPRFGDRDVLQLSRFIESGGTVAIFFGDQSSVANLKSADFLPALPTGMRELPLGRLTVRALQPRHPLFADTWDAGTPFPAVPQQKAFDWKLDTDAKVLLTLSDNVPFLIAAQRGPGKIVIVNASADRSWGDLPLSPAFVPLVKQIARWSAEQIGQHQHFHVGDQLPVPSDKAGVFTNGTQRFAINIDPVESNLRPIEKIKYETITGADGLRRWLDKQRGLVPLWPVFLLLALLAFVAETIISNEMARRRSQADDTHIQTGRLTKRRAT